MFSTSLTNKSISLELSLPILLSLSSDLILHLLTRNRLWKSAKLIVYIQPFPTLIYITRSPRDVGASFLISFFDSNDTSILIRDTLHQPIQRLLLHFSDSRKVP